MTISEMARDEDLFGYAVLHGHLANLLTQSLSLSFEPALSRVSSLLLLTEAVALEDDGGVHPV